MDVFFCGPSMMKRFPISRLHPQKKKALTEKVMLPQNTYHLRLRLVTTPRKLKDADKKSGVHGNLKNIAKQEKKRRKKKSSESTCTLVLSAACICMIRKQDAPASRMLTDMVNPLTRNYNSENGKAYLSTSVGKLADKPTNCAKQRQ